MEAVLAFPEFLRSYLDLLFEVPSGDKKVDHKNESDQDKQEEYENIEKRKDYPDILFTIDRADRLIFEHDVGGKLLHPDNSQRIEKFRNPGKRSAYNILK